MHTRNLALRGGHVYINGTGLLKADLLIANGRIAGILDAELASPAHADVVDVTGLTVLPGAIDPHVHLGKDIRFPRDPDDADLESASAVGGGVTSMLVYLMSADPYAEVFEAARATMSHHSRTNFGFHFVLGTPEHLSQLPSYVTELGVSSFKFFMNFRGDEGAYLGMPNNTDAFMYDLLGLAADNMAMINPHPENIELVWRLKNLPRDDALAPLDAWNSSRPPYVEAEAQQRVGYMASVTGASVYFVHTSSGAALDATLRQKASYPNLFIETCTHYLTLDTASDCGTYGKVNPPLRHRTDVEALWAKLSDGSIDTIGSDHNARHRSAKEYDIWTASAGFPGVGVLLPLSLNDALARRVDIGRIVHATSTRPAQLFGLYPQKGTIHVGADADLAVVDLKADETIDAASQHSAAGYSPWQGVRSRVRVVHTLVGGVFAFRDGMLTNQISGRYLYRRRSGASALAQITDAALRGTDV